MLVIEDNLCNNYCNISLNSTCTDFLYKWTSSHINGEKKIQKGVQFFRKEEKNTKKPKPVSSSSSGRSLPLKRKKQSRPPCFWFSLPWTSISLPLLHPTAPLTAPALFFLCRQPNKPFPHLLLLGFIPQPSATPNTSRPLPSKKKTKKERAPARSLPIFPLCYTETSLSPLSGRLSLTSSPLFSQTRENVALAFENSRFPSSAGHWSAVSSLSRPKPDLLPHFFFPYRTFFLPFTHSQTPSPISSSHSSRQPTHFHFLRTRTRERESTQNQSPSWHSLLSAISSPAPEAALSVNVASDQPPPSPQQQQPFLLSRDKTDVKWDEGRAEGKKINRWKSERRTSTPSPSPLSLHSVSSFFSSSGATFFLLHRNRY